MTHVCAVLRIVLVDPSLQFRRAFCRLMALTPGIEVVGDVASVDKAIPLIRFHRPDVVLLDEAVVTRQIAEHLRAIHRNLRVVGMATFPLGEEETTEAANLDGWLLKGMPTEDLIAFLRAVPHGTRPTASLIEGSMVCCRHAAPFENRPPVYYMRTVLRRSEKVRRDP